MSDRKHHVIESVEVELKTEDELQAKQVLQLMDKLTSDSLARILEKGFKKFKPANALIRLNTMEINLGGLSIKDFERNFLRQFKEEVDKILPELIQQRTEQDDLTMENKGTDLETFLFFLKHGTLPWYVDTSRPGLLSKIIKKVIKLYPAGLRGLLPDIIKSPYQLQRLANLQSSPDYQAIMKACAVDSIYISDEWPKALSHSGFRSERQSITLWRTLFLNWYYHQDEYPENHLLEQFANTLNIKLITLLDELERGLSISRHRNSTKLISKLKSLKGVHDQRSEEMQFNAGKKPIEKNTTIDDVSGMSNNTRVDPLKKTTEEKARLSGTESTSKKDKNSHDENARQGKSGNLSTDKANESMNEFETSKLRDSNPRNNKNKIDEDADDNTQLESKTNLNQEVDEMNIELESGNTRKPNYSESEEIHLHHAGIVLMGPYLPGLFRELGLVVEDNWINEDAKHQGVVVLHFLVTGLEVIEEYQTSLLKVFCGISPEIPLLGEEPLNEVSRLECMHLLESVIEHATVLGKLSIDGLRGSYLLRPGLLSMRDGHWLVQVEKRGYDLLLNQLPWSFHLIKFPWLKNFIVTEWI